jgi:hypothetical protein
MGGGRHACISDPIRAGGPDRRVRHFAFKAKDAAIVGQRSPKPAGTSNEFVFCTALDAFKAHGNCASIRIERIMPWLHRDSFT